MALKFTCLFLLVLFHINGKEDLSRQTEADSPAQPGQSLEDERSRILEILKLSRESFSSDIRKCIEYAREALHTSEKLGLEEELTTACKYLGNAYSSIENNPKAVEYYLRVLQSAEQRGDKHDMACTYNNLGIAYQHLRESATASQYYGKALDIWRAEGNHSGMHTTLLNIANMNLQLGKDTLALVGYQESLQLSTALKDTAGMAGCLSAIGEIYFLWNDLDTSLSFLERALKLANAAHDMMKVSIICGHLGKFYAGKGLWDKAIRFSQRELELGIMLGYKRSILNGYKHLSHTYERKRDFENALLFQTKYMALKDSLKSAEQIRAMEHHQLNYEMQKKELEIAALTLNQKAELFKRNVIVAGLVFLVLVILLLFHRQRTITSRKLLIRKERLETYVRIIKEKSEIINAVSLELENSKELVSEDVQVSKFGKILNFNILTDEDWDSFKKLFEEVYPGFFSRLRYFYSEITLSEQRLLALVKLNLSIKESASMLGISPESVKKSRYRLRKKLELEEDQNLNDFLGGL